MNESLLTSSNNSSLLTIIQQNNEICESYSLLFNKEKCNFSTSSEVSLIEHESPGIYPNQTAIKESLTKSLNLTYEDLKDFNPWLLLFIPSDEEQKMDQIEINLQAQTKSFCDNDLEKSNSMSASHVLNHCQEESERKTVLHEQPCQLNR